MKKFLAMVLLGIVACYTVGCRKPAETRQAFKWEVDRFADIRILRYQVPGFEQLTPQQKELIYYLSEAALWGRDIIFDQNYKHNLKIRKTLDAIVEGYQGDRTTPEWEKFMVYVKRVWFSNGIHHHYSTDKIMPEISSEYFESLIRESQGVTFPLEEGQTLEDFIAFLKPIIFDPTVAPKKVSQDPTGDLVANSAVNFYEGLTQKEAEEYYARVIDKNDPTPISYGLNSRLVKKDGKIVEEVYRIGGKYGPAIEKIVYWLEKAASVAENDHQRRVIEKLIEYYRTGDLRKFDEYSILWVNDTESAVDFINGFIEVYNDPLGMKASWEALVNFKNPEATRRVAVISENAQWFEDHSPIDPRFKREKATGVSAKVITAAMLGGDCYPSTPIGINLPNANWIRRTHGSKSVTLENIIYAYDQSSLDSPFGPEFTYNEEILERIKKYGSLASRVHTDLHEVLGHGSGKLLAGVSSEALKNYHSPIEEARADLFALYFTMDPKMVELGVLPNEEAAKAAYDVAIRNGLLTQLTRIEQGKTIEQAHMRARALVSHWVYEKGQPDNVISKVTRDGKTFFVINDYQKLRQLYGELLREIQRITSEGDYEAARTLVEKYGVQVDQELHREVLERYRKLNLAPYAGFINPEYTPVYKDGKIVDVRISYPDDYVKQMHHYGKAYSIL